MPRRSERMRQGHDEVRLPDDGFQTLNDVLAARAAAHPERGYTFLLDGDELEARMGYAALHGRAQAIAARLQALGLAGERALLLFEPGLDFIAGFFGCLYAGVVAVPTYPPDPTRLDRTLPRLRGIAADAQAKAVLTTSMIRQLAELMSGQAPELGALTWVAVDEATDASGWRAPAVGPDSLAFLQYTSGSTGDPKGVRVSHGNLLHNHRMMLGALGRPNEGTIVGWLPMFHDFGLICNILHTLYTASGAVLFSPLAFLQKPVRWLRAITRYGGDTAGAPNFAYDLCCRRVSAEDRATLDLSTWAIAVNAAEPIRPDTLARFDALFGPCGFRPETWYTNYGLAEHTIFTTGPRLLERPRLVHVDKAALEEGRAVAVDAGPAARPLVSVGRAWFDTDLRVVDPVTRRPRADGEVGEIWVRSPSVADGYWNRPEETERAFGARLADTGEGPFLRTGDLGFTRDGELTLTGRWKDLLVLRGRNYYPQDLERAVEAAASVIRPGCSAAFAVDGDATEGAVVVAEVDDRRGPVDVDAVATAIRAAVSAEVGIALHAVVLLRPGALPKTSSGKLQRSAARAGFLAEELDAIGSWRAVTTVEAPIDAPAAEFDGTAPAAAAPGGAAPVRGAPAPTADPSALEGWLRARVAAAAGLRVAEVDVGRPFAELGLGSIALVELSAQLAAHLGRELPATLAYDHPTIASLARHLAREGAARPDAAEAAAREPIAIVGMGCRFPGGESPDAFWDLLDRGGDAITEVPADRWEIARWYDPRPDVPGKTYSRWGGYLGDLRGFDADFFGFAPREARCVDPQERLLLETCWEALEDAGTPAERLAGTRTGVYVGLLGNEYQWAAMDDPDRIDPWTGLGTMHCTMAGRISYFFGFEGPNMPVDTACSSSLVAIHLAMSALRAGECDRALAGGANVLLSPKSHIGMSRLRALSPTGRSRAFSADADGYVRAEGCGVVLLRRLSDALRDGDPILAVIRGSAVNQDGRSNGPTAPHAPSQVAVIRDALASGGVDPRSVSYVECHGTGTPLGDPIEVEALAEAYGPGRTAPLRIGSVKTNIGHAEAAAGMAGLVKVVLAMRHGRLPASLHFREPNPHIPWRQIPVVVNAASSAWPAGAAPRRAGISAFALSGTNAHLVVEEPPVATAAATGRVDGPLPFFLSGHSAAALRARASQLAAWLDAHPDLALADVARSLATTRNALPHRAVAVAPDADALRAALACLAAGTPDRACVEGDVRRAGKLAFVFPGQGSQWVGMARALHAGSSVFRERLVACERALAPHVGWSLTEVLLSGEPLERVDVVQPALFAVAVALAAVWRSLGVVPDAVIGHSQGEIAAACVAGALSLEDAARIVAVRSAAVVALEGRGAMAAVELGEDALGRWLPGRELAVAAVNGPRSCVVTGTPPAVEALLAELDGAGIFARRVQTTYASHSAQIEELRDTLLASLADVRPRAAAIPIYSTLLGERVDGSGLDATYWYRNLREPVRFADATRRLLADGFGFLVEVSPHPVLAIALQSLAAPGEAAVVVPTLRRDDGGLDRVLLGLGELACRGFPVDWDAALPAGRRVPLPTYPFQREPHWLEVAAEPRRARDTGGPILLGRPFRMAGGSTVYFERALSARALPWVVDHRVEDAILFPTAAIVEMARGAVEAVAGPRPIRLEGLELKRALVLPEEGEVRVQLVLAEEAPGWRIELAEALEGPSVDAVGEWRTLATVRALPDDDALPAPPRPAPPGEGAPAATLYDGLDRAGLRYGPGFRGVERVWSGSQRALGRARLPDAAGPDQGFHLHPALLDACLQLAAATGRADGPLVPVRVGRVRLRGDAGRGPIWCETVRGPEGFDLTLWDDAGAVVGRIEGLALAPLDRGPARDALAASLLGVEWEAVATPVPSSSPGTWLVLADPAAPSGAVAERLGRPLSAAGGRIAHTTVDPRDAAAVAGAVAAVDGLRGVLVLLPLDARPGAEVDPGCLGALHVAQALARRPLRDPPRLVVVTRGAQAVADRDDPRPEQALAWGLGASLATEQPALRPLRVDLGDADDAELGRLVAWALSDTEEDGVALRDGVAYGPRLVRATPTLGADDAPVHRDASYLVTGGLGALGLAAAEWLAARGVGHVVLVGRSGPDAARAAEIAALEATGTRVTVARCDVADRDALAALLASLPADRPLRGVLHTAGVLDDALLADQSAERFATVMRPKVAGAWNLHTLTRDLDFFVLYSSSAVLLASPGQANYVAANAFLDALARHRRAHGLPAQAIGWGAFGDAGLAAAQASRLAGRGLGLLARADAVAWIGRIVAGNAPCVAPCPLDARQWLEFYPQLAGRPYLGRLVAEAPSAEGGGAWRADVAGVSAEEAAKRVLVRVLGELGRVLRTDPARLDGRTPFKNLGVDSLMGMELRNRLEHAAGLALPVTAVWTWPTPERLATHLAGAMAAASAAASPAPAAPAAPAGPPPAPVEDAGHFEEMDDAALVAAALARLEGP